MKKYIYLAIVTSLLLSGCGNGSSAKNSSVDLNSDVLTGTFVDAPVKGLRYITTTQDNYTDENGEFKYKAGETIEFKLGNLSLGTVEAGTLITPYTMAEVAIGTASDKATNIALLLQNLDANRTNTAMIDVSKLKNYNFSDVNLSVASADMEVLLSNKLTAGVFDTFINPSNKILLNTTTVKNSMDTHVKAQEASKLSTSNIIGKDYIGIDCSELFGCEKGDFTAKYTNDSLSGTYDGGNYSGTYETNDGILKVTFGGNDIEYQKILNISSNVVSICDGNSLEVVKACSKPNVYLVTPNNVDTFIATKNSSMKNILTQKTLVTNFSEIQNKDLYQLNASSDSLYTVKMKIDSDGKYILSHYHEGDYWNATFTNGILNVTGWDIWHHENEGDGNVDEKYRVYKYDLSEKTIAAKDFAHWDVFDEDEMPSLLPNTNFTFTSGNMYCHVLWSECWVDKNAIDQMEAQVELDKTILDEEKTIKFTQEWLDANTIYYIDDVEANDNPVPLLIMSKQFRNGIHYGVDSPIYENQGEFENWGNYTIDANGAINLTTNGEPSAYYFKINAIYPDYFVVVTSDDGGKTFPYSENWYTDKAKVQAEIEKIIIDEVKTTKKFTEEYLQQLGNHYIVYRDWDDENDVPVEYIGITNKFANGHIYQNQNLVNLSTTLSQINATYTIEDGKLNQIYSNGTLTSVILEVTDDYLLGLESEAGETVSQEDGKFYLFKDQTKAQAKIDEMNIALLNSTKKFTTGYLNDKTLYMVVKWDEMVRTDDTFNSNGTLAHTNTPDGNFNESWSITTDGKIKVDTGSEGIFYWTIVSATADYIQVQSDDVNGINSGRMYFNQAKAQAFFTSICSNECNLPTTDTTTPNISNSTLTTPPQIPTI